MGINGYIVSIFISELLNFSVSLFQMIKYSKLKLNFVDWALIPLASSFVSYSFVCILKLNFVNLVFNLIANVFLFILVYFFIFIIINYFMVKKT